MVETTSQKPGTIATNEECSTIGVYALLGRISSCGNHFQFNYEHYWEYAIGQSPDRSVAVVRMEHMWDDISRLDQHLGGTGNLEQCKVPKLPTVKKVTKQLLLILMVVAVSVIQIEYSCAA